MNTIHLLLALVSDILHFCVGFVIMAALTIFLCQVIFPPHAYGHGMDYRMTMLGCALLAGSVGGFYGLSMNNKR